MKVALIDYGAGNLHSAKGAFDRLGQPLIYVSGAHEWSAFDAIVLPGVGHFDHMVKALHMNGLFELLRNIDAPLLGICLGMQVLFESSEEAPGVPGLGLIHGQVIKMTNVPRLPHMGWNTVTPIREGILQEAEDFYFAHSFAVQQCSATQSTVSHGIEWVAAVQQGSLHGVQFHPEKSGKAGEEVLKNFLEIARC